MVNKMKYLLEGDLNQYLINYASLLGDYWITLKGCLKNFHIYFNNKTDEHQMKII